LALIRLAASLVLLAAQVPALSAQVESPKNSATPSWLPLIDACMGAGGHRNECIESLPEGELRKLEAWERRRGMERRALLPPAAGADRPRVFSATPSAGMDWNSILSLPPEEAIALAYSVEYRPYAAGILGIVFSQWAKQDPQAAYDRMLELRADFNVPHLENQVLKYWLTRDPEAALSAAAGSGREVFGLAIQDYAHLDPEAALMAASQFQDLLGQAGWQGVIRGVASIQPDLAADYVAGLGIDGEPFVDLVVGSLQPEQPEAALNWLLAHYPRITRHYESIATFFFVQDPEAAFLYPDRMADPEARRKFERALCRAREINESSRLGSALPQPAAGYTRGICRKEGRG
jgi:hypothetical protein